MISITAAGRLGRDAELRQTQGGAVLSFSVAIDVYRSGAKETAWIDCSLWGKRGESLAFLSKGTAVTVTGSGDLVEYPKKDGTTGTKLTCRVDQITLQSKRDDSSQPAPAPVQRSDPAPRQTAVQADDLDDDIPF